MIGVVAQLYIPILFRSIVNMVVYKHLTLKYIQFILGSRLFLVTFLINRDGSATLKCVFGSLRSKNSIAHYSKLETVYLLNKIK